MGWGSSRYLIRLGVDDGRSTDRRSTESPRCHGRCVMAGGKTVWGYGSSEHPETWTGAYDTRAECIADGREQFGGFAFWIQHGVMFSPAEFVPGVDSILDQIADAASCVGGEAAEDFPSASKEAEAELDSLLREWANRHLKCTFWSALGEPEEIAWDDAPSKAVAP